MYSEEKRIWAKTASYRLSSSVITGIIVYVLTGKPIISVTVGGIELVLKTFWYYLHEEAWARVEWGRVSKKR